MTSVYGNLQNGDLIRVAGHIFVFDDVVAVYYKYYPEEYDTIASCISVVDEDNARYVSIEINPDGTIDEICGRGIDGENYYYDCSHGDKLIYNIHINREE